MSDPRLPLKFILRLAKHVLKGLEYLHDECNIVHSGMSFIVFHCTIAIAKLIVSPDLKPNNLLLLPANIDTIVMHELAEHPSAIYEFPKTIPPNELPFFPVLSAHLPFDSNLMQDAKLHWVIADLGHGTLL